jgi:CheY-like chemotaxis protein
MVGNKLKEVIKSSELRFLADGLSNRAYLEYTHSIIRVSIGLVVLLYFLGAGLYYQDESYYKLTLLAVLFQAYAVLILLSFRFVKQISHVRSVITLLGDHATTCLLMYNLGESGTPLLTLLLWITISYRFKFGINYLYMGVMFSTAGLLALLNTHPFWSENTAVGYSLLFSNIIIPYLFSRYLGQIIENTAFHGDPNPDKDHLNAYSSPKQQNKFTQTALIFSKNPDFFYRLEKSLRLWGIIYRRISSLTELQQSVASEIDTKTSPPLVLLDANAFDHNIQQPLKLPEQGDIRAILINTDAKFKFFNLLPKTTSVVYDLDDKRELYNAIHSQAHPNSNFPNGVLSINTRQNQKDLNKFNVLIAEETSVNRLLLEKMLKNAEFEVTLTEDGESALEMFEERDFDLAIVAMQLPKISGLEVIREYKAVHGLSNDIPFIVMSSTITKDAVIQCRDVGVDIYLKQPEEINALVEHATHLIQGRPLVLNSTRRTSFKTETLAASQHSKYLDRHTLGELSRLSEREDFFGQLMNNFLNDVYTCADRMAISVELSDIEQFMDNAHAIKGAASCIGATMLFKKSNQLYQIPEKEIRHRAIISWNLMKLSKRPRLPWKTISQKITSISN